MQTLIDRPESAEAFTQAAAQFERARREAEVQERFYSLADRIMRLRVVGAELTQEVFEPFEHLRTPPDEPFLTIDVWNEDETGVGLVRSKPSQTLGPYGMMTASADGRLIAEHRPHSAAWLDRRERRVVAWVSSPTLLHLDERARPFHRMLAVCLGDVGIQSIHAGLVASERRGALFVGMGGSGKSTSSICCFLEQLPYLGDDFVGLAAGDAGAFTGYSLYCSALTKLDHMQRYPILERAARPGHHAYEEKSVVSFNRLGTGQFASKVAIGAIVLPRVVPREATSFCPASARDALLALAPSSLLYLPGGGPRAMAKLSALVEHVPAFWLELGRDLRQVAPEVRSLLAQV